MRDSLLDISSQTIFGPSRNGTEQLLPGMHQLPNRSGERKESGRSALLVWVGLSIGQPKLECSGMAILRWIRVLGLP